jgi:hypothetical protein
VYGVKPTIEYNIKVADKKMFIEVYNRITSTKFKIVEELPDNFQERYRSY